MENKVYQMCTGCVMDTTDPELTFTIMEFVNIV